jgi:ubiquinone/menaquinone biosynthesis C-methylase UbiE
LPFSINEFDLVICLEGIEHVPIEIGKQFIQESARILSDDGKIVLTNPLPDPVRPPNPYHIHEYDLEELEVFLKPYFEKQLEEIRKIGGVSIVYYVGKLKNRSN